MKIRSCKFFIIFLMLSFILLFSSFMYLSYMRQFHSDRKFVPFAGGFDLGFRSERNIPLLTLFTSMDGPQFYAQKYSNTLNLWQKLNFLTGNYSSHEVITVLFTNDNNLIDVAQRLNWTTLPIPRKGTNGLPILKDLFMTTVVNFESVFYCFSTADMLFDNSLIKTLVGTGKYILRQNSTTSYKMLLMGKRTNAITSNKMVEKFSEMRNVFDNDGLEFTNNLQDYFCMTRFGYPWIDIPDFVVGRPGYDNWVVYHANSVGITTIDASATIRALHQSVDSKHYKGWSQPDSQYNRKLFPGGYDPILATTDCADLQSEWDGDKVVLKHREGYCE